MKKIENEDSTSYVRVENSSNIILSVQELAKLYTKYANLLLDTKKLHDVRVEKRKALFKKINELESQFKTLVSQLPEDSENVKAIQPDYVKTQNESSRVFLEEETKFENLKTEFEKIREQLRDIK